MTVKNLEDYIETLEVVIDERKCEECTDFNCDIATRNFCGSATLNKLKNDLIKMLEVAE